MDTELNDSDDGSQPDGNPPPQNNISHPPRDPPNPDELNFLRTVNHSAQRCNIHRGKKRAPVISHFIPAPETENHDLRSNEEKKKNELHPIPSHHIDRYKIGFVPGFTVLQETPVLLVSHSRLPQEMRAALKDETTGYVRLVQPPDVWCSNPNDSANDSAASRPSIHVDEDGIKMFWDNSCDVDMNAYVDFKAAGEFVTINSKKEEEIIQVSVGDFLCIKVYENSFSGLCHTERDNDGTLTDYECTKFYLVHKAFMNHFLNGTLPEKHSVLFFVARKLQAPTDTEIVVPPCNQQRSKMIYDCVVSGEKPSGASPNHDSYTSQWYNSCFGPKPGGGLWMDDKQIDYWLNCCAAGKKLRHESGGLSLCSPSTVDYSGRRTLSSVKLGDDGNLWFHHKVQTNEIDRDRATGAEEYRIARRAEFTGVVERVKSVNDLFYYYNQAWYNNPVQFERFCKYRINEINVPDEIKLGHRASLRMAFKRATPYISSFRSMLHAQVENNMPNLLQPVLFQNAQKTHPVESIIHHFFHSNERCIKRSFLNKTKISVLKTIARHNIFWKEKVTKGKNPKGTGKLLKALSIKEILNLILRNKSGLLKGTDEVTLTNGDAGYVPIFDNDTETLYPIFEELLSALLASELGREDEESSTSNDDKSSSSSKPSEHDNGNLDYDDQSECSEDEDSDSTSSFIESRQKITTTKEFVDAVKQLIDEVTEQVKDARGLGNLPVKEPRVHKLYAIIYYDSKGNQTVHLDVSADNIQAVRATKDNTLPTVALKTKKEFQAQTIADIVNVNKIQCDLLKDSDDCFPSMKVILDSLKQDADTELRSYIRDNCQLLQLPFCHTMQCPLIYEAAMQPSAVMSARRKRKTTENDKRTLDERASGKALTPKIVSSVSIKKAAKQVQKERFTREDYKMKAADTIIMSGGIPHFGPAQKGRTKLFFDITLAKDGEQISPYDHTIQVDLFSFYVHVFAHIWNQLNDETQYDARQTMIRWLIATLVIRKCSYTAVYNKFDDYPLFQKELQIMENQFASFGNTGTKILNLMPSEPEKLFRMRSDNRFEMTEIMKDRLKDLYELSVSRKFSQCDFLFSPNAIALDGPSYCINLQTNEVHEETAETSMFLTRADPSVHYLIELDGNSQTLKPYHQYGMKIKETGATYLINTEIYKMHDETDTEEDNQNYRFPVRTDRQHKNALRSNSMAVYALSAPKIRNLNPRIIHNHAQMKTLLESFGKGKGNKRPRSNHHGDDDSPSHPSGFPETSSSNEPAAKKQLVFDNK